MTGINKMENSIYFDHAATTPIRSEVATRMKEIIDGPFGNPSSIHGFGRKAKVVVEETRKMIAKELNCEPGEIIFTSGGTEADNASILLPVRDLGFKRIITSPIEHHAVTHSAESVAKAYNVQLDWVNVKPNGEIDFDHLEELLQNGSKAIVSLMHANNEIGNLLDLKRVGDLVHKYNGLFHSDTVQTIAHYKLDFREIPIDFASCASHKFYGPKGVGFMYMNSAVKVGAYIEGGAQERGFRGGTENVIGIAGLGAAFKVAYENLESERTHILSIKKYMKEQLLQHLPGTQFNGLSGDLDKSLYSVLSAEFPQFNADTMLLFNLDIKGIAVSGGSACTSGSDKGSHVIGAIKPESNSPIVRFSFGKDNTKEQVDTVIEALKQLG